MKSNDRRTVSRRGFLGRMGVVAAASAAASMGGFPWGGRSNAWAQDAMSRSGDPRFLIVLTATGGASIMDAMMAIRQSESRQAARLNTFPDAWVEEIGPFRAVNLARETLGPIPMPVSTRQADFVRSHQRDMLVATWERTSVNHLIGQRRSVTGNSAWAGRTLQEINALTYGAGFAIPNVNLASGTGFTDRGTDGSMPGYVYGEAVANPRLWPLSLDGYAGVRDAPPRAVLERARRLRNTRLDPQSRFAKVFGRSPKLQRWMHLRGDAQRAVESEELIRKLMAFPESADLPLSAHGLSASADSVRLMEAFPDAGFDPLEAQAALAFLLIKHRVSVSVTLGPNFDTAIAEGVDIDIGGFGGEMPGMPGMPGEPAMGEAAGLPEGAVKNPPIAFDFSHQAHRSVQGFMWQRILGVADRLIRLLKSEEWANGESLWDRTMIYVASDFGRSKTRPEGAEEFSSGHDLNNGILAISPLLNGGNVLGGIDSDTGLTYGFDLRTGAPTPGSVIDEPTIYGGLAQALGVSLAGANLADVPAMRR